RSDLDAFVQLLRQAHRDGGGVSQLLGGLLLQRAGAERRRRGPAALALFERGDFEGQLERVRDNGLGGRRVLDLRLVAVELVQPGLESLAVLLEVGLDGPVFLRHEPADLLLPLADQPRSEEHTSELQSRFDLVCRLLLEKKKKNKKTYNS